MYSSKAVSVSIQKGEKMSVKDLALKALTENSGTFLSGEELSNKLGVSRTAVWKAIKTLREEGYAIEAVTNKGYMLMESGRSITEDSLRACLPSKYKNNDIYVFDVLDSTNIYAKQLAIQKAPHGTIVLAHRQTGGKGRLGRSFFSPKEGIYLSIIIKPDFDISKSVLVTSAAAVAVAEAIEKVCGKQAGIKWVNDVYVDQKKVCGILCEGINDFETGQIESIVIGIGINTSLKGFPKELLSIAGAVTGDYCRSALAAQVIARVLDLTFNIEDREYIKAYREKSLVIGKTVSVYKGVYRKDPQEEIPSRSARVLDMDDDGGLMVLYSDGTRETLTSGEISIRL